MNEESTALLEELAEKLGTTSEYLWAALLRQAPISIITDLLVLAVWVAVLILTFRKLKKLSDKDYIELLWIFWGLGAVICGVIAPFVFSNMIIVLLNPEYWALKQLLP